MCVIIGSFQKEANMNFSDRLYVTFVCIFCTVLILTNVVGTKLIPAPFFPHMPLCAAILVYPLTFLLCDIVSEIWGEERTHWMVRLGFFMSLIMLGISQAVLYLPAHSAWAHSGHIFGYQTVAEYQKAFESVFKIGPVMVGASLTAYLSSQWTSIRIFHILKKITSERHLWLRNNLSTIISQGIDTLIINSILLFYGFHLDLKLGFQILGSVYLYKIAFALLDTPLCYVGVKLVRQALAKRATA
ncbi:MAG: queuosine precursor transporter [Chlamydiia bacterium]|nr:queuosine precursor transporter [Chlamydiia bacterium]